MKLMVSTHNWNSKVDSVIWDIHSELSKKFKNLHTFVYTPLLMTFYFNCIKGPQCFIFKKIAYGDSLLGQQLQFVKPQFNLNDWQQIVNIL